MRLEKTIQLKEGEEILEVVRRHCFPYTHKIIFIFIWIVLPFFFIFPLLREGAWGVGLFFFILITGLIYGWRQFAHWKNNVTILTNFRIIDIGQNGFFDRTVSEVPMSMIDDVSFRIKGIFPTLFKYGNILIETSGNAANIEVLSISKPQVIHELINDLRVKFPKRKSKKKRTIEKLVHDMSDEDIELVRKRVKKRRRDQALRNLYDAESD